MPLTTHDPTNPSTRRVARPIRRAPAAPAAKDTERTLSAQPTVATTTAPVPPKSQPDAVEREPLPTDGKWLDNENDITYIDHRTRDGRTWHEYCNELAPSEPRNPWTVPPLRADGSIPPYWTSEEQDRMQPLWDAYIAEQQAKERSQLADTVAAPAAPKASPATTATTAENPVRAGKCAPPPKPQFTDVYERKPSRKTRRRQRKNGVMHFTTNDRVLVETVAAFGWLSRRELAALVHSTPTAVRKKCYRLVEAGLLSTSAGTTMTGGAIYTATGLGKRKVLMSEFPTTTPSMRSYDHHTATVAVASMLERRLPGSVFITEKELQQAATGPDGRVGPGGSLSPRVLRRAPWLNTVTDFSVWLPMMRQKSELVRKRPDGLLVHDGKVYAIEVELTLKKPKDYEPIVAAYATAVADGHIAGVWYFASDAQSRHSRTKLAKLLSNARHDLSGTVVGRDAAQVAGNGWLGVTAIPFAEWKPQGVSQGWLPTGDAPGRKDAK